MALVSDDSLTTYRQNLTFESVGPGFESPRRLQETLKIYSARPVGRHSSCSHNVVIRMNLSVWGIPGHELPLMPLRAWMLPLHVRPTRFLYRLQLRMRF